MMLVSAVFMVAVVRAEAIPIGPPVLKEDPIQMKNGPTNMGGFRGTVVAIGPRSITVDGVGGEMHFPSLREVEAELGGAAAIDRPFHLNSPGPRMIELKGRVYFRAWGPLSWHLPTGRGKTLIGHMLSQVQLGDRVGVSSGRIDGQLAMFALRIERRPGGKIPPSLDDHPHPLAWKLHEAMQAEQDAVERGIPIPRKYAPPPGLPRSNGPYEPREAPHEARCSLLHGHYWFAHPCVAPPDAVRPPPPC